MGLSMDAITTSAAPRWLDLHRRAATRAHGWLAKPWIRRLLYLVALGYLAFVAVWVIFAAGLPSDRKSVV